MINDSGFCSELDYKAAVTKHDGACRVFEEKMHAACQRFEKVEDEHLQKMHLFVTRYIDVQEELIKEMQEVRQEKKCPSPKIIRLLYWKDASLHTLDYCTCTYWYYWFSLCNRHYSKLGPRLWIRQFQDSLKT